MPMTTAPAVAGAGTGTCPHCPAPLVNVQGIAACADCGWIAPR